MKRILSALFCIAATWNCAHAQSTATHAFDWLLGTWENQRTRPGDSATETWSMDASGNLTGLGCTVRGTDTVFVEKLQIVHKEGKYYYVADVSHNAAPVYFEIVETRHEAFVSENPEHDFPKKITYRREGDMLHAAISGGTKEIPFTFRRKE